MITPRPLRRSGFTLTELLIVIAILLLISVATLPTALVAIEERQVSDAAGTVQAAFALTRDSAVNSGEPRGLRLVPDPILDGSSGVLASNRILQLEPGPPYTEGQAIPVTIITPSPAGDIVQIAVVEQKWTSEPPIPCNQMGVPGSPTSWYFNIRQGETIRFEDSSIAYRIVGPMTSFTLDGRPIRDRKPSRWVTNTERFINADIPDRDPELLGGGGPGPEGVVEGQSLPVDLSSSQNYDEAKFHEVMFLLNGRDDDGDGYIDEQFDGIDNDGDGIIDPGYNGVDDNNNGIIDEPLELLIGAISPITGTPVEYEAESFVGRTFNGQAAYVTFNPPLVQVFGVGARAVSYSIARRPVVARDGQELSLPSQAVIDLTTSGFAGDSERSRVPVDPATGFVDLLVYPNGQVVPSTPFGFNAAMSQQFPFFYLWIAEREDVVEPIGPGFPLLPMPQGTPGYDQLVAQGNRPPRFLEGERRMVVISPNTGHASVSPITLFDATNRNAAFVEATDEQQTGATRP